MGVCMIIGRIDTGIFDEAHEDFQCPTLPVGSQ